MASVPSGKARELREAARAALEALCEYKLLPQHEAVVRRLEFVISDVEDSEYRVGRALSVTKEGWELCEAARQLLREAQTGNYLDNRGDFYGELSELIERRALLAIADLEDVLGNAAS